ncbi:MAG: D-alanyl-D-alanine carboxypeptidase family protein [Rickettsiaceae bacterium]|nr:D-alanyl-D-alanine carboxypeptidase family protein [Rickettsiaceae bacterium]
MFFPVKVAKAYARSASISEPISATISISSFNYTLKSLFTSKFNRFLQRSYISYIDHRLSEQRSGSAKFQIFSSSPFSKFSFGREVIDKYGFEDQEVLMVREDLTRCGAQQFQVVERRRTMSNIDKALEQPQAFKSGLSISSSRKPNAIWQIFIILLCTITFGVNADAKRRIKKISEHKRNDALLVIEEKTNKILAEKNKNSAIYPASLTKLMTLYIVFDEIEKKRLKMNQRIIISKNAQNVEPMKLGLSAGQTISVRDAINSLIIKSANDISIAVAEHIDGSEQKFAGRMNRTAVRLGMTDTHFVNSHGLHHDAQKTTAIDLAKLTLAIKKDFPRYYPLFAADGFEFGGKIVKGHNKVTRDYKWANGMKTGYTKRSGFNLITTAKKGDREVVAVLTGQKSACARDGKMMALLDRYLHTGSGQRDIAFSEVSRKNMTPASLGDTSNTRDIFLTSAIERRASPKVILKSTTKNKSSKVHKLAKLRKTQVASNIKRSKKTISSLSKKQYRKGIRT